MQADFCQALAKPQPPKNSQTKRLLSSVFGFQLIVCGFNVKIHQVTAVFVAAQR
jgi:hypothetical protein